MSSLFLKTHFTNFINLDVSRVTGFPEFPNKLLCFVKWFACVRPEVVELVRGGELACVQGLLFVVFEPWIGGLCFLLDHVFVSDVSSRCPCLMGLRLVFFK
jgi:hypothetical protein